MPGEEHLGKAILETFEPQETRCFFSAENGFGGGGLFFVGGWGILVKVFEDDVLYKPMVCFKQLGFRSPGLETLEKSSKSSTHILVHQKA